MLFHSAFVKNKLVWRQPQPVRIVPSFLGSQSSKTVTLENNPSFYFAYMLLSMMPEHIMLMDSLYIVSETNSASWGSQSLCPLVSPQALYFGRWLFLWCWSMLCLLSLWDRIPLYLGHNHFTLQLQPKLWFLEGDYFCYAAASILYEIADYLLRTGTHF